MPQVATAVHTLKSRHEQGTVITIDCGDHMDRMYIETEGTQGIANIQVMNATGYDIALLGNNEGLTYSIEDLAIAYGDYADFVVLGSNLFDARTEQHPLWMKPYHISEINGLRMGFIGVTAYFIDFYRLLNWDIRKPMEVVAHWVKVLREQVDVIVVLSHLGLNQDKQMAQEITGIDLIFGGHTHHLLEKPLLVENTYLCATGKFGQYVGEVELTFDLETHCLLEVSGRCIEVNRFEKDESIVRLIQEIREKSELEMTQVVAQLDEPLEIHWYEESSLGNLLATGIRKWVDAEIGLTNSGQLLQSLRHGEITKADLLQMCPSPINPCRMLLRGDQIQLALEESLLLSFQEKAIQGYGFRGKWLGSLSTSGLRIEYDPEAPSLHKIKRILVNEEEIIADKIYRVGTIDMFTFGIGYLSLQQGTEIEYYLPEFLRDLLLHELRDPAAVAKCQERHWIKA
ncbi:MAG: yunD [Bacilli bacterium]|nr:yunD [Bacilli bacterium]